MTVGELLDRMRVQDGNKIVLYDLEENASGAEYKIPTKFLGWKFVPADYKQYSNREVFGVSIVSKTIRISMS